MVISERGIPGHHNASNEPSEFQITQQSLQHSVTQQSASTFVSPPPLPPPVPPHTPIHSLRSLIQLRIEIARAITILALHDRRQDVSLDLTGDVIPELDIAAVTGTADGGTRSAATESCEEKVDALASSYTYK